MSKRQSIPQNRQESHRVYLQQYIYERESGGSSTSSGGVVGLGLLGGNTSISTSTPGHKKNDATLDTKSTAIRFTSVTTAAI